MTTNDIDQIKARVERATSGDWEVVERIESVSGRVDSLFAYVKPILSPPIIEMTMDLESGEWVPVITREDAEFIAHAHTDIPALVAEVEGLRGADDRYKALRAVAMSAAGAHYQGIGTEHAMSNLRAAIEDIEYFVREGFGKVDETP